VTGFMFVSPLLRGDFDFIFWFFLVTGTRMWNNWSIYGQHVNAVFMVVIVYY